ncbi:hypothetical protein D9M71_754020 [compost metagenome]
MKDEPVDLFLMKVANLPDKLIPRQFVVPEPERQWAVFGRRINKMLSHRFKSIHLFNSSVQLVLLPVLGRRNALQLFENPIEVRRLITDSLGDVVDSQIRRLQKFLRLLNPDSRQILDEIQSRDLLKRFA